MSSANWQAAKIFGVAKALPVLMLAVGLVVTFMVGAYQRHVALSTLNLEFSIRSQEMFDRIEKRLQDYGRVLRGGAGLFASTKAVGRKEWRSYVGSLNIERDIPGIQGLGYSQLVKAEDKAAHIERIRREGFPDYTIWPDGVRDIYTPVIYLEPFSGRNLRAFGYDTYSEPVRRAAMIAARDEGRLSMSGKVRLVQEVEAQAQAGFLMYLPVYGGEAMPTTLSERQKSLQGWVYAPFRMNELMKPLVGDGLKLEGVTLDILIFDGEISSYNSGELMYHFDNDFDPVIEGLETPMLMFKKVLSFGGHEWTVIIHCNCPPTPWGAGGKAVNGW